MRPIAPRNIGADAASPPARWLFVYLALICAARVVALWFNATDLFFDEAQYWSWGREPAFGYYSKPPLIAWIIGATTALCGDSTFCIRLPSPLLHTATALVIHLIGRTFLSPAVGFWAALSFATLPGISLSSSLISTDVPLLLCWAVALYAYLQLVHTDRWWPALLLGLAIGVGMNAKYAMVFFVASIVVHLAVTPSWRRLVTDPRLWASLALGCALILPNMAWNLQNSFATFAHTADNARWGGSLLNFGKGLEFLGAQFGVFGPILFASLLATVHRAWREGLPEIERFLLCMTLPVLLAITVQAFVSRAHANWAATAYVAGSLLVASVLIRLSQQYWLKRSLVLHLGLAALLALGTVAAGRFTLPLVGDPFQRLLGWKDIVAATEKILADARGSGQPYSAVFADERAMTAELLYYMRTNPTPVRAWRDAGRPRDHYELTRPLTPQSNGPALLVSLRADPSAITKRFVKVTPLGETLIPAGQGAPRKIRFFALSGLKPL